MAVTAASGSAWAGFGWADVTAPGSEILASGVDMTAYASCTLHVSAKSTVAADFQMIIENHIYTTQNWINASSIGFAADGKWHDLAIPLSAWSATCDLTNVDYFLGVSMSPYVTGETITMDNVYWTLPPSMTSVSLIRKKTSASGFRLNVGTNKIVVSLPTSSNELISVELFNVAGRKIYSGTHQAYNGILNIPTLGLSTGTYIMSIKGGNTTLSSSFVVTK